MHRCAACQSSIDDRNFLKCCTCSSFYHNLCVGVPLADLRNLSSEAGSTWVCPECRNKVPRSDNSNTPSPQGRQADRPTDYSHLGVSRNELREIIQEEMRSSFKECIATFRSDINEQLKAFKVEISSLTESINFMHDSIEKLNTDISYCKTKVDSIIKDEESLRSDLKCITNRFNQLEQITRASNLELQCAPERKSENLLTIVQQLAKTVSCPINESDVFYCSRIAKKNPDSPRPRSILIKLSTPRARDTLLARRVAVYVAENLSPENKVLHAMARSRARELQYKHVWVRGGRIYMRKTDTSEYVLVRNESTLDGLS
ncbi:hypothetical protein ACJJTC_007340 [Scirpophaga incertulas]